MTQEEYISLYEKYKAGNCTPDDIRLLEEYKDSFELTDGEWNDPTANKEQIRLAIYTTLQKNINTLSIKLTPVRYWVAAATLIFALGASLLIYRSQKNTKNLLANKPGHIKTNILPGSNKAILTLANGSKIILDNSRRGKLTSQGTATVNKTNNGQLVYNIDNKLPQGTTLYNTATTPRGGQYELVLSDGTKVWLNAASSLKYPVAFSGNERHVELTGEAYFEVAKNAKMPFSITVKGTTIQVLGTHFNVLAYSDDNNLVTTLLEGSVKMKKANSEVIIKPGQQALLTDGQANYQVSDVNTDMAVAWKNGYFMFDNDNIQNIMKEIARWYDVDVRYNGTPKDQIYGGTVSRFANVTDLLRILELTGTIHFKIEGRVITVMP